MRFALRLAFISRVYGIYGDSCITPRSPATSQPALHSRHPVLDAGSRLLWRPCARRRQKAWPRIRSGVTIAGRLPHHSPAWLATRQTSALRPSASFPTPSPPVKLGAALSHCRVSGAGCGRSQIFCPWTVVHVVHGGLVLSCGDSCDAAQSRGDLDRPPDPGLCPPGAGPDNRPGHSVAVFSAPVHIRA